MAPRDLNVVLYGATGFTGKLAANYIAANYGKRSSFSWAIAGRNAAKLDAVAAELPSQPNKKLVADADDEEALSALVAATDVVITTAGPFARYGSKLVQACARHGTHYCDITGEVEWVREMVARHDAEAQRTGARIVHLCGHDSIPWDLMTLMLAKKLAEQGEELTRVDMFNDIKASASGGTLETMLGILFGKKPETAPEVKKLGFDAMQRMYDGSQSMSRTINCCPVLEGLAPSRAFFFMAGVNRNAVQRSNALNDYGRRVEYSEGLVFPTILHSIAFLMAMASAAMFLAFPPTRYLLRKFVLPKPGEGPSEKAMQEGYLRLDGRGTGIKGGKVRAQMNFSVDPGYLDTARMLVEAGLALTLNQADIKVGGGVYTPGACQGEVLLKRLCDTGTTFEFIKE